MNSKTNNYIKIFRVRTMAGGYDAAERARPEEHYVFFDDTLVKNVVGAFAAALLVSERFEARGIKHTMCVYADCDGLPPEVQSIGVFTGELATIPPPAG